MGRGLLCITLSCSLFTETQTKLVLTWYYEAKWPHLGNGSQLHNLICISVITYFSFLNHYSHQGWLWVPLTSCLHQLLKTSLLSESLWLPFASFQKFHVTVHDTLSTGCFWPQVWSHLPFLLWASLPHSKPLPYIFLWSQSFILWE